jgi:3-hydroxymyristoyl/3-hydroxydecanoyl-(acyl carrier protein) dehydratase
MDIPSTHRRDLGNRYRPFSLRVSVRSYDKQRSLHHRGYISVSFPAWCFTHFTTKYPIFPQIR